MTSCFQKNVSHWNFNNRYWVEAIWDWTWMHPGKIEWIEWNLKQLGKTKILILMFGGNLSWLSLIWCQLDVRHERNGHTQIDSKAMTAFVCTVPGSIQTGGTFCCWFWFFLLESLWWDSRVFTKTFGLHDSHNWIVTTLKKGVIIDGNVTQTFS